MTETADLKEAVDRLVGEIRLLREELVRKDVYDADERGRIQRMKNLEDDVHEIRVALDKAEERRTADRRLLVTAFALPLVLLVIQLYLTAQIGAPK